MFSSNQEFYTYIESLMEKLDEANERQWSSTFRDALAISSLPGEILGKLWLTLREFQATEIPQRLGIKNEIQEVTESLGKIIGH